MGGYRCDARRARLQPCRRVRRIDAALAGGRFEIELPLGSEVSVAYSLRVEGDDVVIVKVGHRDGFY